MEDIRDRFARDLAERFAGVPESGAMIRFLTEDLTRRAMERMAAGTPEEEACAQALQELDTKSLPELLARPGTEPGSPEKGEAKTGKTPAGQGRDAGIDSPPSGEYARQQVDVPGEVAGHTASGTLREWGAFIMWAVLAALTGAAVGLVAVAFHWGIDLATALRQRYPRIIWLLPAAGAAIALCYRWCGMDHDKGTNQILLAVRDNEPVKLRMAPLIFFSTIVTHLVGGSAGREGAALQLGGSMASWAGAKMGLDDSDRRMLVMCGMAASFSALFGTPITAAVFSIEVASVGVMYFGAIVPCLIASVSGFILAQALGLHAMVGYEAGSAAVLNSGNMVRTLLLGAGCAGVSVLFCVAMHLSQKLYKRVLKNQVVRAAAGGCLVLALILLLGTQDYCGAGDGMIRALLRGQSAWYIFLLKILITALTLGAGFRGGEIVPALCVGCAFGTWLGPLLGLPQAFAGAMAMAAVFCGATNCPISSFLLAFELFGGEGMILYALCCGVSYMLSGYYGLYSAQKLVFSKFRQEEVDQMAR